MARDRIRPLWKLPHGSGGGGYTGPLDLVPGASVAFGQRALASAKRGTALYTIRESSGNTTQSFNSDPTTGNAPTASIAAFLNGANGFVTDWNDQSGNGMDALQGTAGRQPQWLSAVHSAKPSLLFSIAGNAMLATAGNLTITNPQMTLFMVMLLNTLVNPGDRYRPTGEGFVVSTGGMDINPNNSGGFIRVDAALEADATGNGASFDAEVEGYFDGLQVNVMELVLDGTSAPYSGTLYMNGTPFADTSGGGSAGFGSLSHPLAIGSDDSTSTGKMNGQMFEYLFWNSTLSSGQRLAIRQNIGAYYGIVVV